MFSNFETLLPVHDIKQRVKKVSKIMLLIHANEPYAELDVAMLLIKH